MGKKGEKQKISELSPAHPFRNVRFSGVGWGQNIKEGRSGAVEIKRRGGGSGGGSGGIRETGAVVGGWLGYKCQRKNHIPFRPPPPRSVLVIKPPTEKGRQRGESQPEREKDGRAGEAVPTDGTRLENFKESAPFVFREGISERTRTADSHGAGGGRATVVVVVGLLRVTKEKRSGRLTESSRSTAAVGWKRAYEIGRAHV